MSIREAARRAGISEGRWRQVELGEQKVAGITVPVQPRAATVVAMAEAVSGDVAQALELAGFNPADYEWATRPATERLRSAEGGSATMEWFSGLPREDREQVLADLQKLHVDTELEQRAGRSQAG